MKLFSKSPKKPTKKTDSDDEKVSTSSRTRSPTKKPVPSSSTSRSSKAREEKENHKHGQGSVRNSRSLPKSSTTKSPRHPYDPNTHPLNLPPDQLRKLSALSSMSESERMDVDSDGPSAAPTSPPPQTSMPGAFDAPKPNGTSAPSNGEGPVPPPHKSNPTSPAAASPPTAEEAEAFKAAGNKFYKAKEYKKAIEEYTKAVQAVPSSATYLSNRAAAYISNGQYVNALDDCTRADELDPDNAKILLRLARIYTSLGRPKDALDTYARIQPPASAKDIAPAKAMLQHIAVAEDALKNGTTGSMALHALDQAEKLLGLGAPKPRKWQLMRGEAYLKMGNVNALGDAQNVAMSLLRSNNADPEALVLRGRALYAQGDNEKAIQHFRKALNCDPDYKDAVKYLRIVQKLDRMKGEGNADYKAGRWQAAIDKYSEALEVDPLNKGTNSKLLQNRALCRNRLKDYVGAIEDCERAIALDPSYTKAKKTKATALGQSGNWEQAVRELKELQEQDPSDGSIAKEVRNAELELKKSKRKDYYKILGVEKDADENMIKKAYRKAAIIHHPDKNRDDEDAAERFKDIGEAYETLSDPEKRARYDSGEDLVDPMEGFAGGGMGGGGMNIDPEILMQMFGAQMGGGGGARGGSGGFHSFGGGMPGGGGGRQRGAPQGFPGGFSFQ
ncbi:tetratricopeptide [Diplocarpon rosae]|nr:tetratricopeptide [Diplocarpon rosae]